MPSSVEPAHPAEPTGPPGQVLNFDRRIRRHRPAAVSSSLHIGQAPDLTPEQRLAVQMEALMNERGHTLADDDTADIYRTTLDAMRLMLDGSHAEGLVRGEEHQYMSGMVEGMRGSPDEL